MKPYPVTTLSAAWLVVFFLVLGWSGINPKDTFTWILEVLPAVIALIVLAITYRSFPLTPLAYLLVLIHCIILMVGGHYTYAEVPLFNSIQEAFDLARNNYDKVGHFAQGFIPAIIAREVLVRRKIVNGRGWVAVLAFCICLAFSAFYELVEWWVALGTGSDAEAFLGTQGYEWDTQSDMAYAALGAIAALASLARLHDRQISWLKSVGIDQG